MRRLNFILRGRIRHMLQHQEVSRRSKPCNVITVPLASTIPISRNLHGGLPEIHMCRQISIACVSSIRRTGLLGLFRDTMGGKFRCQCRRPALSILARVTRGVGHRQKALSNTRPFRRYLYHHHASISSPRIMSLETYVKGIPR